LKGNPKKLDKNYFLLPKNADLVITFAPLKSAKGDAIYSK
jgi:hypothetical protein